MYMYMYVPFKIYVHVYTCTCIIGESVAECHIIYMVIVSIFERSMLKVKQEKGKRLLISIILLLTAIILYTVQ